MRANIMEAELGHRYATSLYWMFCQMGFGLSEIVATTDLEAAIEQSSVCSVRFRL